MTGKKKTPTNNTLMTPKFLRKVKKNKIRQNTVEKASKINHDTGLGWLLSKSEAKKNPTRKRKNK